MRRRLISGLRRLGKVFDTSHYLTFTATSDDTTFTFSNDVEYAIDAIDSWKVLSSGTPSPTLHTGQRISWKAHLSPVTYQGVGTFNTSTGAFSASGNPLSLLYGDDGHSIGSVPSYAFARLFQYCRGLQDASQLYLSFSNLESYCYYYMFNGCNGLTKAPQLNSMRPKKYCYAYMFYNCTALVSAPDLPATELSEGCYTYIFSGCSSLAAAPTLSATALTRGCYTGMFNGCKAITVAPTLPATTLAEECYSFMFFGCTGLTKAPDLPATTTQRRCYYRMFYNCSKLKYIKALFTNEIGGSNLQGTLEWVQGVASSGTFVKNSAAEWSDSFGVSAIPANWTVETVNP